MPTDDSQAIHRKAAEPVASKDETEDRPEVTHDLYLADGSVVESSGAIPTHYGVKDRAIPVVHAVERERQ